MIEGKRVRLRSFELSDVDEIMKYWNNMELRNFVGSADRGPVARNEEDEWIRNTWKQRQERKAFTFAIETKQTANSSAEQIFSVSIGLADRLWQESAYTTQNTGAKVMAKKPCT